MYPKEVLPNPTTKTEKEKEKEKEKLFVTMHGKSLQIKMIMIWHLKA